MARRQVVAADFTGVGIAHNVVFRSNLALHDILNLLIEEHVVMVTVEQVNVERYRRKYPHVDVFVGQECEQAATNAKHDGPIGEDGEPAYVGPDVVGMSVVENLYRPAVCQDEPAGKSQAVDHEPCGHDKQSGLLGYALGQHKQNNGRKHGEQQPETDVGEQSAVCDVEAVEQCCECRTEEPVAQKIG